MPSGRKREVERDSNGHRIQQSVLLDYSDKAALNHIAKRDDTTVTELIRKYITWGIEVDTSK